MDTGDYRSDEDKAVDRLRAYQQRVNATFVALLECGHYSILRDQGTEKVPCTSCPYGPNHRTIVRVYGPGEKP